MPDIKDIDNLLAEALAAISAANSPDALEAISVKYLGRKGQVTAVLRSLKELPIDRRKQIGAAANKARVQLEQEIKKTGEKLKKGEAKSTFDPTLPGISYRVGAIHPLTRVLRQVNQSFERMGFEIAKGPEIESDYYNFEGLNFPPDHPARDMQDTFYLEGGMLLRTHTSPVQIRALEKLKPPVKIIAPGKNFRNEAISARAYYTFYQVEGFMVDEGVSMADLKGVLVAFCRDFFGEGLRLRFRPSFFPFTEPSAEVDISCFLCGGKGCRLCKYAGWLEILGCGMIDPNVLEKVGYDSEKYTGYAFGMGIERVTMLRYMIDDIRLFYNNDIRFIRQFL
ncbi:MAG: phenylalanine--tRNA ligase subunit alpha [Candidatus Zixiibacteriota bacterium]|nr:MAG: phenylalanine--tRNA ligase subunit alpha [candidate division Zixibacteria bacterium]